MNWAMLSSFLDPEIVEPGQIHEERRRRNIRSKYDNLSLRVKIDEYEYVFSRFSLSRYLMACMVQYSKATWVSRQVKQDFIDSGRFEVTQEEVTARVFDLLGGLDCSELTRRRFNLIQKFNLERTPLIIFISGTGFLGKSGLAFRLGERLNISTILQTDIVCALTSNNGDHLGRALWYSQHASREAFIDKYVEFCEVAKAGIEGDIVKTLTDGKPLIIEGIHLDPDLYLQVCGKCALNPLPGFRDELKQTATCDKNGFIVPLLVTRKDVDIRSSIMSTVEGSQENRMLGLEPSTIADYAVTLQERLLSKFPPEYIIDIGGSDGIDHIHRMFLQMIEDYYGKR